MGWATVMAAVRDYGQPLVDDPNRLDGVHTLGVDETAFLAATPTAGTTFATGIVALNGRARLLDPSRRSTGLKHSSESEGLAAARQSTWAAYQAAGEVGRAVSATSPRPDEGGRQGCSRLADHRCGGGCGEEISSRLRRAPEPPSGASLTLR